MPSPQQAPERTRPAVDDPSRITEPGIVPEHPDDDSFKRKLKEMEDRFHEDGIDPYATPPASKELVHVPKPEEPETGDDIPNNPEEDHGGSDKDTIKIVVAGLDREISGRAAAEANARLDRELAANKGFSKLVANAWKGHAMRDMYLTRYRIEAERSIRANRDLYTGDTTGVNASYKADTAVRYLQEFENDLILHEKAGETRTELDDSPEATKIKSALYDLMRRAAMPGSALTDRDAFNTEADTVLHNLSADKSIAKFLESADVFAHNLFDAWKQVELVMSNDGLDIEEALSRTQISVGEARAGARSEYHRTVSDRLIERMSRTRLVNLVNEDTIAVATAAIYGGLVAAGKTATGIGSTLLLIPGLASGLWAGMRESTRVKQERDKLAQDVAEGRYQLDETLEGRTGKLRETIYDQKSIEEIRSNLLGTFFEKEADSDRLRVNIDTPEKLAEALQAIGGAKALIDISDKNRADLLHSSTRSLDKVRGDLMTDLATLQVEIRRMVPTMDDAFLTAMGVPAGQFDNVRNGDAKAFVTRVIESRVGVYTGAAATGEITESMAARDRAFNVLRGKRIAGAVVIGAGVGIVLSVASQEAGAVITDKVAGIFEGNGASGENSTLLRSLISGLEKRNSVPTEAVNISGTATTTLPEGYSISQTEGNFTLAGPENLKVENLKLGADGALTAESLAAIKAAGLTVDIDTSNMVLTPVQEKIANVTPQEFIKNHPDMKTFKVDEWYGYGTKKSDFNELRLGDPHRVANGDVVIKGYFKGLSNNGSGLTYDPVAGGKNGSLQYSVTIGNKAYFYDFEQTGNGVYEARVPADQIASQTLFDKDGQILGNYGRAVEVKGEVDGVVHVNSLATDVGKKNITGLTDVITKNEPQGTITYKISGPSTLLEREPTLPPFIVGPLARGGLQVPKRAQSTDSSVPARPATLPPSRLAITAEPNNERMRPEDRQPRLVNPTSPRATGPIDGGLYESRFSAETRDEREPVAVPPQNPRPPQSPQNPSQTPSQPSPRQYAGNTFNVETIPSQPNVSSPAFDNWLQQVTNPRTTDAAAIAVERRVAESSNDEDAINAAGDDARAWRNDPENARRLASLMFDGRSDTPGWIRVPLAGTEKRPPMVSGIARNILASVTTDEDRETLINSEDSNVIRGILEKLWQSVGTNIGSISGSVPLAPREETWFRQAREYSDAALLSVRDNLEVAASMARRNRSRKRRQKGA